MGTSNKKLMACFFFQYTNYWTEAVGYPQKMVIINLGHWIMF